MVTETESKGANGAGAGRRVADVMTPDPVVMTPEELIPNVARKMRDQNVGAVIIAADGHITGIVTDRDIVVRLVAEGQDPSRVRVGDICSRNDLAILSPEDTLEQAVGLIREKAVRRLPVVDDGRPVGIVSLGDLALAKDPRSALADVSAAKANV